jgi:hypothetical protein
MGFRAWSGGWLWPIAARLGAGMAFGEDAVSGKKLHRRKDRKKNQNDRRHSRHEQIAELVQDFRNC